MRSSGCRGLRRCRMRPMLLSLSLQDVRSRRLARRALYLEGRSVRRSTFSGFPWGRIFPLIVVGSALGLLAAPISVAQQTRVYRVGFLGPGSLPPGSAGPGLLPVALHKLGYVVGQNLILESRWAEGRNERFPGLAAELVALKPDVIIAHGTPASIAAMRATTTIPIVMTAVSDPVVSELVSSLSHPGGNVTGSTDFGIDLAVKQMELVRAIVPKATRVAALMSDNPAHPPALEEMQKAAENVGLTVVPVMAASAEEFEPAFASMGRQNASAFILLGGEPFTRNRDKLIEVAAKRKMPGLYVSGWYTQAGGLLSYGIPREYEWRGTATYVDKILKGAKPSDLPVQQPTEFELAINLKTAKALGLTLPAALLLRADKVFE